MDAIEQFIRQKNFPNKYEKAHIGLLCASTLLTTRVQTLLKKYGITPQQFNALRILRGQYPKPVNQNDIKARLIDRNSDASRLVERLFKLDLITRVASKTDRRAVDICINQKGLKLLEEICEKVEPSFTKMLEILNESDIDILNNLLNRIVERGERVNRYAKNYDR